MFIYLDCASSTAPSSELIAQISKIQLDYFANPSSPHQAGKLAKQLLEESRSRCLDALTISSATRVIFCSGASEANNLVATAMLRPQGKRPLILAGPNLHPSLSGPAQLLQRFGAELIALPCTPLGQIDQTGLSTILATAAEQKKLPALLLVNAVDNETGLHQDISTIGTLCQQAEKQFDRKIWLHIDGSQWLPRLELPECNWQSLVISGHKIGSIRGAAALLLKRSIQPIYQGGGQEFNYRPGSENLAAIYALSQTLQQLPASRGRVQQLQRYWNDEAFPQLAANFGYAPRFRQQQPQLFAPGLMQLEHRHLPGEVLMRLLEDRNIIVGTGSACHSNNRKKQRPPRRIRVSFSHNNSPQDLSQLVDALNEIDSGPALW